MGTKYVDLRCSRRLTVNEAKLLLVLLDNAAGREATNARAKLMAAVVLVEHKCVPGVDGPCNVCGEYPGAKQRVAKRRAETFQRSLMDARSRERVERAARAESLLRNPPDLRLSGGLAEREAKG